MKQKLAIQQLIAIAGSWVFLCIIVIYGLLAGTRSGQIPGALSNIGIVLSPFCLGYWVSSRLPKGTRAGRWMWLLPAGGFLLMLMWTGFNFGWLHAGEEFFNFSRRGEKALGAAIFTLPVCSSILYSIRAALRLLSDSKRRRVTSNA